MIEDPKTTTPIVSAIASGISMLFAGSVAAFRGRVKEPDCKKRMDNLKELSSVNDEYIKDKLNTHDKILDRVLNKLDHIIEHIN